MAKNSRLKDQDGNIIYPITKAENIIYSNGNNVYEQLGIAVSHATNISNPHSVTKEQLGLGNVDNTSDLDKPISNVTQEALNNKANASDLNSHTNNTDNPHNITASQIGAYSTSEVDAKLDEIKQEFDNHTIECNCSHEVEITGFGEEDCNLAINDQDVVFTKIQGQTRKKSLNLAQFTDKTETTIDGYTYSISNGVVTVSGTSINKYNGFPFGKVYLVKGKTYTLYINNVPSNFIIRINYNVDGSARYDFVVTNSTPIKTITYDGNTGYCEFRIQTDVETTPSFEKTNFYIQVLEGTYTTKTIPPFEPYDNTLVNSKCDFVSTGRNLLPNSANISGQNISIFFDVNIEAGKTYTFSIQGGTNSDAYGLWLNMNGVEVQQITSSTGVQNSNTFTATVNATKLGFYPNNINNANIMLNYGDTALPYEPYIEDKMQCGIELGQWDYHDNINHITHRKTGVVDLGSLEWTSDGDRFYAYVGVNVTPDYINNNILCAKYVYDIRVITEQSNAPDKTICCYKNGNNSYVYIKDASYNDTTTFKTAMKGIMLYYETTTETTEENILPSGYKVWYKGMQIQKTDTIPYILTKQYAISLASQVLNNVSIDRSQQKQIDELDQNIGNLLDLNVENKENIVSAINEVNEKHLYRLRLNISDTYWECLVSDIYNLPLGQTQLFNADKTQACTDAVRNDIIKIFREQMNGYFIWNAITDTNSIICRPWSDCLIASEINGSYDYLYISFGDINEGTESWTCDANDDYDVYMEIYKVF